MQARPGVQLKAEQTRPLRRATPVSRRLHPKALPAGDGGAPGDSSQPADGTAAPADSATGGGAAAPAPAEGGEGAAAPAGDGGESQPAPAEGDQSSRLRRSPFHLTALQAAATDDDAAPTTTADAPPADAAAAPADATAPAADDQTTTDPTSPADPAASTEAPADAAPGDAATAPAGGTPADGKPADVKPADPAAPATGDAAADAEKVEYVPLAEVHDQIRETLAREKAVAELTQQVGEAAAKLQSEYNQYGRRVVEAREAKRKLPTPQPKLANLQWLADEYGLEYQTTEPLTGREMFETPVGKATDDQSGRVYVTQAVFSSLELFEPFLAKELDGNWFLVTKTQDIERRIPAFEEVRDQVAAAWKRIEAAKLAEKTAKDLAVSSQTAAEPFEQLFKDTGYEVVPQTGMFSWRTYAVSAGLSAPELSEVPELKNVGPEFMEAAFSLDGTKSVGLLNYDHSEAYVIRLHARQYTPEELKKLFLAEDSTWMGRYAMRQEHQSAFSEAVNRKLWEDLADFKFDEEWEQRRNERLAARN